MAPLIADVRTHTLDHDVRRLRAKSDDCDVIRQLQPVASDGIGALFEIDRRTVRQLRNELLEIGSRRLSRQAVVRLRSGRCDIVASAELGRQRVRRSRDMFTVSAVGGRHHPARNGHSRNDQVVLIIDIVALEKRLLLERIGLDSRRQVSAILQ